MYEYANRLQARGHRITVLHSIQRPYRKIKSPVWWKQLRYRLLGLSRPPWFELHPEIISRIVPEITDRYVPEAEIVIGTWWEMTYMINGLAPSRGKKFNLIQDYEVWKGHEELVHNSYRLPVQHLVIARYLEELVAGYSHMKPVHIPNAIDTARFSLNKPVRERDPFSIIMLYSEEPRKGTKYGLEALKSLKSVYPQLKVDLFGVYAPPKTEEWMKYHQKPAHLPELMNRNSIFLTPSLGEGWALPPAEAMACGCTVVCTRIGGHADYAIEGETALLTEPQNSADIVTKLKSLFENHALREQLALAGYKFITTRFSWEESVGRMEECFYTSLNR